MAAIDVAYSAGPYPEPPRAIRSANGKIYVHWTFHRDERQCATSGVDYFILDNAPKNGDKGEASAAEPTRGLPAAPPPKTGLKRLEREVAGTPAHRAKLRELDAAAGEGAAEPDHEASRRASQQVARADNPAARGVAEQWFSGYARGDVGRMVKVAAFPFSSVGGVAAQNPGELQTMLRDLLGEAQGRRAPQAVQLYSAAGLRGALGGLPPGFSDGGGLLFALTRAGGDTFVLVLSRQSGQWKATGLVRR